MLQLRNAYLGPKHDIRDKQVQFLETLLKIEFYVFFFICKCVLTVALEKLKTEVLEVY